MLRCRSEQYPRPIPGKNKVDTILLDLSLETIEGSCRLAALNMRRDYYSLIAIAGAWYVYSHYRVCLSSTDILVEVPSVVE